MLTIGAGRSCRVYLRMADCDLLIDPEGAETIAKDGGLTRTLMGT